MFVKKYIGSFCFVQLSTALVACGSSGMVPNPDADANDAIVCSCPPAETLTGERLARFSLKKSINLGITLGWGCEDKSYLLVGGCSSATDASTLTLVSAGFDLNTFGDELHECRWEGYTPAFPATIDITTSALCVQEPSASMQTTSAADDCECPPVEPLLDRITRVARSEGLPATRSHHVRTMCDGGVLIGGGCMVTPHSSANELVTLNQAGFANGGWQCSWNNPVDNATWTVTATAVCLRPPAPGTAPEDVSVEERVILATRQETLPAQGLLGFSVPCDPGDFLITGSCMLDTTEAPSHEITLIHHGPESDQTNPNAWRCAWNNPTDATPTGSATAVCLKPLSPSP
jgi:hypothetical protein